MSHITNSISSMDRLSHVIEGTKKKNKDYYQQLIAQIESARNSGNLEPENHYQLMNGYLGSSFEANFQKAFETDAPKMVSYLQTLKNKIEEYLKISV